MTKIEASKTSFENLQINDTDFSRLFRPANVFGLGPSQYAPQSETVTVKSYIGEEGRLPFGGGRAFPSLNRTCVHEQAHSMLASRTLAGTLIQRLVSLKNAFCILLCKKMLEHHKRIWIPISSYLQEGNVDLEIGQQVRILQGIVGLEKTIIDGWRIGQELYALAYTIFACTTSEKVLGDTFRTNSRNETVKALEIMAGFSDNGLVHRIAHYLQNFCASHGIDWDSLDMKILEQVALKADNVFGEDKEAKEAFLGWLKVFPRLSLDDRRSTNADEMQIRKEQWQRSIEEYYSYGGEYIEAVEILQRFTKPPEINELFFMTFPLLPLLFTPRLTPKEFINDPQKIPFGSIDNAMSSLEDFLFHDIFELFGDKKNIQISLQRFITMQSNSGWVTLRDRRSRNSEICGTQEWVDEVINLSVTTKQERKLMKKLIAGQITPASLFTDLKYVDIVDFLSLLPIRLAFRVGLPIASLFRKRRKRKPILDTVLLIFRELNIRSSMAVGQLFDRHARGLVSLLEHTQDDRFMEPAFIHKDETGVKLVIRGKLSNFLCHTFWLYLLANLSDIVCKKTNYALLCPIRGVSDMLGEKMTICTPDKGCPIRLALSALGVSGSVLCGSMDKVRHIHYFANGTARFGGEFPFKIFLQDVDTNQARNVDIIDNVSSQLRSVFNSPRSHASPKKGLEEEEARTWSDIRRDSARKLRSQWKQSGYSKIKIMIGIIFHNSLFIILGILFKVFELVFMIPVRLIYFLYWITSLPQRERNKALRRKRIKAAQEGSGVLIDEIASLLDQLAEITRSWSNRNDRKSI